MKLQPLYDLQQEINRLYVAGSKLSAGDPRIQKHIAVFSKMGEKVPVFAKISSDLEELLKADKEQSAEKLIAVSILLYSVLYTQGETIEENQTIAEQKPVFDVKDLETNISYLEIKPVIESLTSTGSGRLEIVEDALKRGLMADSRLYHYVDMGLNDKYAELADYVENKVIPTIGVGILSTILKNFKMEDTKEQERRFRVLRHLGYEGMDELADEILKSPHTKLQIEAIEFLGENPKNEALLLSMMNEKGNGKAKAVYKALINLGTDTALEALVDAYLANKSKTRVEAFTEALSLSTLPKRFDVIFEKAKQSFVALKAVDTNKEEEIKAADVGHFVNTLISVEKAQRRELLPFFSEVLAEKKLDKIVSKKNYYSYQSPITTPIIQALRVFPSEIRIEFYSEEVTKKHDIKLLRDLWYQYLQACVDGGFSKESLYETFYGATVSGDLNIYSLISTFYTSGNYYYNRLDPNYLNRDLIDPRWVDMMINMISGKWNDDFTTIIQFLIDYKGSDEKLIKILSKNFENSKIADTNYGMFLTCLLEIADTSLVKKLMLRLEEDIVSANLTYFRSYMIWSAIERLPIEYATYFATLATQYVGKSYAKLFEEIAIKINR